MVVCLHTLLSREGCCLHSSLSEVLPTQLARMFTEHKALKTILTMHASCHHHHHGAAPPMTCCPSLLTWSNDIKPHLAVTISLMVTHNYLLVIYLALPSTTCSNLFSYPGWYTCRSQVQDKLAHM